MAAGLLAAASLTTLVIVASVRGADTLATTAIALAIITFIVQLIVYVAQAEQSRRENELTQTLHGELRSNLAGLTASAEGTNATMATINEKVLDRALEQTGSSKLEVLPEGFTRDVARNVAELVRQSEPSAQGAEDADFRTEFPAKSWGRDEDQRVIELLSTWPTDAEEVDQLRSYVEGLPDDAAFVLSRFAEDEKTFRDPDQAIAPALNAPKGPFGRPLYDRGLIEDIGKSAYGSELTSLTEAGRRAARAFTAAGDPPDAIADLVRQLRTQASQILQGIGEHEPPDGIADDDR
jgi:hypothetical protein